MNHALHLVRGFVLALCLIAPVAVGQQFTANFGEIYLPLLAEQVACGPDQLVDFGFTEDRARLLEIFVIPEQESSNLVRSCLLFRDVHGVEARRAVTAIMREVSEHGYWHGIPGHVLGLQLVQSETDRSRVGFSFLNEDPLVGPDSGVAGFDLDHEDGLLMYLWERYIFNH